MEGSIKFPINFLKQIRLRAKDGSGGSLRTATLIIDEDPVKCKILDRGMILHNITQIVFGRPKYPTHPVPFYYVLKELEKLCEGDEVLDCHLTKNSLNITDHTKPTLLHMRLKFGYSMDNHVVYINLIHTLENES